MAINIEAGSTDQSIDVFLQDSSSSTGAGLTGLLYNSSGLTCYYREGATGTSTQLTLATQTVGGAHSDGGFVEVDSTNMPGVYRLDLSDTMVSDEGYNTIYLQGATNLLATAIRVNLNPVPSDVVKVDGNATAADNLEFQYDGTTGLSGDTFPATQAAVADIGSGTTGAINYEADEDNVLSSIKGVTFVGAVDSGALSNTAVEDGVSYTFSDTGNVIDVVLGFDVGGSNSSNSVEIVANVDGNADEMIIKAYNFDGSTWDSIGTLPGSGGANYTRLNLSLLGRHTGTGADLGKTYIRFDTDSTTPANLQIDKCIVGAVSTSRSVGYTNGSIWIDTTGGTAGTESFVNGVADNPVSSYANALTIASNVDIHRFTFTTGDNITITQSHAIDTFFGYNYQVAMNNQVPPSYIEGAEITGICNGTAAHYVRDCRIGTTSTPLTLNAGCVFVNSGLVDVSLKDAAAAALDIEFLDCHGNTQGSMFPGGNVDFGTTAGTNHEVSFQRWGGPCTITNLKAGDTVYAHGNGTFILDSSCTGGSFRVAGMINLVDNSGGAVSILEDGRLTRSGIYSEFIDGTNADAFKADVSTLATQASVDTVDSNVDAILVDTGTTLPATLTSIEGKVDTVDTVVDAVKVKADQLTFTVANQVDSNALTGGGGDDAAKIYTYFTTGTNEDAFKADVSALATAAALATVDSNVDAVLVDTGTTLPATLTSIEGKVDTVDTVVDAVKLKTDLIPADFTNQWNNVYDVQITGITATVETAAGKHSVAGTVMMSTNASLAGGVLTAKKPSDDTTFQTYTITTSASADNITGVS